MNALSKSGLMWISDDQAEKYSLKATSSKACGVGMFTIMDWLVRRWGEGPLSLQQGKKQASQCLVVEGVALLRLAAAERR
jgi:hypothetical protein